MWVDVIYYLMILACAWVCGLVWFGLGGCICLGLVVLVGWGWSSMRVGWIVMRGYCAGFGSWMGSGWA